MKRNFYTFFGNLILLINNHVKNFPYFSLNLLCPSLPQDVDLLLLITFIFVILFIFCWPLLVFCYDIFPSCNLGCRWEHSKWFSFILGLSVSVISCIWKILLFFFRGKLFMRFLISLFQLIMEATIQIVKFYVWIYNSIEWCQ